LIDKLSLGPRDRCSCNDTEENRTSFGDIVFKNSQSLKSHKKEACIDMYHRKEYLVWLLFICYEQTGLMVAGELID
jgi:hypothetical protein